MLGLRQGLPISLMTLSLLHPGAAQSINAQSRPSVCLPSQTARSADCAQLPLPTYLRHCPRTLFRALMMLPPTTPKTTIASARHPRNCLDTCVFLGDTLLPFVLHLGGEKSSAQQLHRPLVSGLDANNGRI